MALWKRIATKWEFSIVGQWDQIWAYNLVLSNLFKAVWSSKTINLFDLWCPFQSEGSLGTPQRIASIHNLSHALYGTQL